MVGFIGDIHGHFSDLFSIFKRYPDVSTWFQVGDLGGEKVEYPEFPSNFYYVQGNHENWDHMEDQKNDPHFLQNGTISTVAGLRVAALGGNYAPTNYKKPRQYLVGARRRHFVEEEVYRLLGQDDPVDILITHEAPSPYYRGGRDIGQKLVTQVLCTLMPKLHVFGHHHYRQLMDCYGYVSVGMAYGTREIMLYDTEDSRVEFYEL